MPFCNLDDCFKIAVVIMVEVKVLFCSFTLSRAKKINKLIQGIVVAVVATSTEEYIYSIEREQHGLHCFHISLFNQNFVLFSEEMLIYFGSYFRSTNTRIVHYFNKLAVLTASVCVFCLRQRQRSKNPVYGCIRVFGGALFPYTWPPR